MHKKTLIWADAVRVVAIFFVVLLHASAPFLYQWSSISQTQWFFANIFDSFSRISVPLFVMLSGALLLDKKESAWDFYLQRIRRIALPWFFWTGVYVLWAMFFRGVEIHSFVTFKRVVIETFFGGFWFLVMLSALYLVTPLWRVFVRSATAAEFFLFFLIWFFSVSFMPMLAGIFHFGAGNLPLVWQYSGYFLLGYWLMKMKDHSFFQLRPTTFLLLLGGGFSFTILGTFLLTVRENTFSEVLYSYVSPGQVFAAIGVFLLILQKSTRLMRKYARQLHIVANASFGVFLIHSLILEMLFRVFPAHVSTILFFAVITFALSTVFSHFLSQLSLLRFFDRMHT